MTVKDLIEKLKEFPEDMRVCVDWNAYDDIEIIVAEYDPEYAYHKPFKYVNLY